MPDEKDPSSIHPERIDLSQLDAQQLRELRDAIAMRLASGAGAPGAALYPVSTFSYGDSSPTFVYGAPQASFAYGAPEASFAYGAPQAAFTYGAPMLTAMQPTFSYGAPQASFAYGAPQATFAYGAPQANFTYGAPQADFSYGAQAQPQILYSAPQANNELSLLLLQRWDSARSTIRSGFRRVALGLVAGTTTLASAALIASGAALPAWVTVVAAIFFDLWFVIEMLRSDRGEG